MLLITRTQFQSPHYKRDTKPLRADQFQASRDLPNPVTWNRRTEFLPFWTPSCWRFVQLACFQFGRNWGSRLHKPLIAAILPLLKPVRNPFGQDTYLRTKGYKIIPSSTDSRKPSVVSKPHRLPKRSTPQNASAIANKSCQQFHVSSCHIKLVVGFVMCFTAGSLWYKHSVTKLAIFYKKRLLVTQGKGTSHSTLIKWLHILNHFCNIRLNIPLHSQHYPNWNAPTDI